MNQRTSAIKEANANNNNEMKAIIINSFEMVYDQPKPLLLNNDRNKLLIRVLTCSLSPSDYRMWSGATSKIKYPPYGFPYIPLGDVCGIIEDVSNDIQNEFKIGDYIIATWDYFGIDCLAEYAVISSTYAIVIKDFNTINSRIDSHHGSALANSCIHAYDDVLLAHNNNKITNGDRILVSGGSGGMGTSIMEYNYNQPSVTSLLEYSHYYLNHFQYFQYSNQINRMYILFIIIVSGATQSIPGTHIAVGKCFPLYVIFVCI